MFDWLVQSEMWIALGTLTALEIVLGSTTLFLFRSSWDGFLSTSGMWRGALGSVLQWPHGWACYSPFRS